LIADELKRKMLVLFFVLVTTPISSTFFQVPAIRNIVFGGKIV